MLHLPDHQFTTNYDDTVFFASLVPVRVLERSMFLGLLYRRCELTRDEKVVPAFWGIVVLFLFDCIGVFAVL